ncbi:hypothetical protein [Clostridium peptidivorans]|nr:hypothetical protein [Clostridium peptidivorans]
MKRIWEVLNNRYGIYTKEQLKEEMKKTVLDIGIFTMPINEGNRINTDI